MQTDSQNANSATPTERPLVLLVEDDALLAEAYMTVLAGEAFEIVHVETGAAALAAIETSPPAVILLDLLLPDMHGDRVVAYVSERHSGIAVVVATSQASVNVAVDAMRAGAFDFLVKPIDPERLIYTLRNALERQRLRQMVESYEQAFTRDHYAGFIGASSIMQSVYRVIDSAAASKATVFVTGESGTGKELCAEAIHQQSQRRGAPFVALNCAAIPADLLESAIFGHVKGAFTGATSDRAGAASRANGGTLFFDEICDMDIALQTKLLRFVQTGAIERVGGHRIEQVDVRFVCATNRDPLEEVHAGRFREDLYYRLHVVPIRLPALRERGDDILMIAQEFLRRFAAEEGKRFVGFSDNAKMILLAHGWPGNVRQLENTLRHVTVLNDGETVTASMLAEPLATRAREAEPSQREAIGQARDIGSRGDDPRPIVKEGIRPLAEREREIIEEAIALCGGNIPVAAAHLGISNSTIYRKRRNWADDEGKR